MARNATKKNWLQMRLQHRTGELSYKNNRKEDGNKNTHITSEVLNPAELLTIDTLSHGDDKIIDEDLLEDK